MGDTGPTLHFRLDPRSGKPAYRQLVDQVHDAVRLGLLRPGDRLPSVREVVGQVMINPNTVLRAYRELEADGTVEAVQGRGTFIAHVPASRVSPSQQLELYEELLRWVRRARRAGMDDDGIRALYALAVGPTPTGELESRR
jgi:GntR family transcriptional regulator